MLDLDILKKHVRAEDFSEDDAYLSQLLTVATAHVVQSTERSVEELNALGGGELPVQLQQAILLLAGHWYNMREAVSVGGPVEVPYSISALIKPFRKLV